MEGSDFISTAQRIDDIRDWLNETVCPAFEFKIPNNEDVFNAVEAPPKAYSRYMPLRDNLPKTPKMFAPEVYIAPSIIVMPSKVKRFYDSGSLDTHLLFTIWEPEVEEDKVDNEGWRGIMNLLDYTARELSSAVRIENLLLDIDRTGKAIEYGLFNDEEATPDLRPYYMGYLTAAFKYDAAPVKYYGAKQSKTNSLLD